MDNKYVLENSYQVNKESAQRYVNQNNLPEAKAALQKALKACIGLIECSVGSDKARYKANAQSIASLLEKINEKLASAEKTKSPVQSKPTTQNKSKSRKDGENDGEQEPPALTVAEALDQLNSLEGLGRVKDDVKKLVERLTVFKQRKEMGLPVPPISYHMVFLGNPGTGKTTVARIMASIYRALGVLSKGQLVETSRKDLVAEYIGQTAPKTQQKIDEALGGVLFVDEAYMLNGGSKNDFGQEAIDTILKAMEDNREDFVVIVAGYDDLMKSFIDSNPGLSSRFNNNIKFADYTGEEMFNIFNIYCKKSAYVLSPECDKMLREYLNGIYAKHDRAFGNARGVRNVFEEVVKAQAHRVWELGGKCSKQTLTEILPEDIRDGIKSYEMNKLDKK